MKRIADRQFDCCYERSETDVIVHHSLYSTFGVSRQSSSVVFDFGICNYGCCGMESAQFFEQFFVQDIIFSGSNASDTVLLSQ